MTVKEYTIRQFPSGYVVELSIDNGNPATIATATTWYAAFRHVATCEEFDAPTMSEFIKPLDDSARHVMYYGGPGA
jgi:hypothetical protein